MSDNLRIGQIAQKLEVSPSTVRNWVKLAEAYLHEAATRRTNKRFSYEDLNTLQTVKRFLEDGHKWDEIPGILDRVLPTLDYEVIEPPPDEPPEQRNALATVEIFEQIQALLDNQTEQHKREIAAKDETINLLKAELERARLPWYKKLL